ncbi:MAG: hypothetical protein AVDCRST_MAG74-710 [uncultured Pyrinomonadaceae bacterium]|uniref:Uncharacterized protein n=1 Tax=uncultured Pyrinomonadaceae bacterium TaxID=2283094 RepID=A0A6J4NHU0_9BACT|nr:MAG: hypothetical protein AVDCRST_MAG74-710 [uncultured Pyrinomonadaceae bacterium]
MAKREKAKKVKSVKRHDLAFNKKFTSPQKISFAGFFRFFPLCYIKN